MHESTVHAIERAIRCGSTVDEINAAIIETSDADGVQKGALWTYAIVLMHPREQRRLVRELLRQVGIEIPTLRSLRLHP